MDNQITKSITTPATLLAGIDPTDLINVSIAGDYKVQLYRDAEFIQLYLDSGMHDLSVIKIGTIAETPAEITEGQVTALYHDKRGRYID
jgi:hypothetical protein